MPELGPYGSVRGALSNERPYRDLGNVIANYLFERSHRFAGIQPNSGLRDCSRLSCGVGDPQPGPSSEILVRNACAGVGHSLIWARSRDDPAAAIEQYHCSFCAGLLLQRDRVYDQGQVSHDRKSHMPNL
jgi:hypothetical protein